MGTKGRDLSVWLVLGSGSLAVVTVPLSIKIAAIFMTIFMLSLIGYVIFFRQCHQAQKRARGLGLKAIVLLPLPVWWARLIARYRVKGEIRGAFEIHLSLKGLMPVTDIQKAINCDLDILAGLDSLTDCLFIWETHIPLPAKYRRLIRQLRETGAAVLEPGRWPIPSPPTMGVYLKRHKAHVKKGFLHNRKEIEIE